MKDWKRKCSHWRRRMADIVEMGSRQDPVSRGYDIVSCLVLLLNVTGTILYTFEKVKAQFGSALLLLETLTVAFFAVDYVLRVWTAPVTSSGVPAAKAIRKYVFSLTGLVDLLSFLPHYLPIFFPAGAAVFRIFRVVRIFRLFQINAYYSALNVITEVLNSRKQASSLCMYSLENAAQPEVFSNAFSGIWWAASTLLTVGYGDIYPITIAGKIVSIFITFLGVGMVAIPTGIISAGFVDHYSRIKRLSEYAFEEDILFIEVQLHKRDKWVGLAIKDMELPQGVLVGMVRRGREHLVPRGDLVLKDNDILILGAAALKDENHIDLKRIVLRKQSSWNGRLISELDISRQAMIVMVKRRGTMLIPHDDLRLREGDHIILYSQSRIADAEQIPN